jgi:molybdopterin-guanine dinucleotide biosynthesis protein A
MLGIVLCGGQSLRMGSDKGLLNYKGRSWAQIASDKLCQMAIPVKISVNARQYQPYADLFPPAQLIADDPFIDVKGPLAGLLSAHLSAPEEDIFLLACDMLLMEKRLMQSLLDAFESNNIFDACIFTNGGQLEPLCGIYSSSALKIVMQMLANEELKKSSMKFVLGKLQVLEIPVADADVSFFANFNAQQDRI